MRPSPDKISDKDQRQRCVLLAEPPGTPAQEGAEHFGQRARVYVKIPPAIYSTTRRSRASDALHREILAPPSPPTRESPQVHRHSNSACARRVSVPQPCPRHEQPFCVACASADPSHLLAAAPACASVLTCGLGQWVTEHGHAPASMPRRWHAGCLGLPRGPRAGGRLAAMTTVYSRRLAGVGCLGRGSSLDPRHRP